MVLSYETYSLVRYLLRARPLEAITLKGIRRPVVPYAVEGHGSSGDEAEVLAERDSGLELFLDIRALGRFGRPRLPRVGKRLGGDPAAAAVDERIKGCPSPQSPIGPAGPCPRRRKTRVPRSCIRPSSPVSYCGHALKGS